MDPCPSPRGPTLVWNSASRETITRFSLLTLGLKDLLSFIIYPVCGIMFSATENGLGQWIASKSFNWLLSLVPSHALNPMLLQPCRYSHRMIALLRTLKTPSIPLIYGDFILAMPTYLFFSISLTTIQSRPSTHALVPSFLCAPCLLPLILD